MSESRTRLECTKHGVLVKVANNLPEDERRHALNSYANAHFRAYPSCAEKVTMRKDPEK